MAQIVTIYRATIFYEGDKKAVESIEDTAFKSAGSLEVETMGGNAACAPYIVAEGESLVEVTQWTTLVETAIRRHRKARLM